MFYLDITRLCPAGYGKALKWPNFLLSLFVMNKPSDMDFDAAQSSDISSVTEIVAELRAGRMVILVDEEDRENEGDLVMAAEHVTPEAINFMARYGRGLICLTLTEERCRQLDLPLMVSAQRHHARHQFHRVHRSRRRA